MHNTWESRLFVTNPVTENRRTEERNGTPDALAFEFCSREVRTTEQVKQLRQAIQYRKGN